ncbi:lysine-sensitive aspartokinase 3 [Actinobacillus delphinicola]|uniref:Aspartokinase n=1 Tax=Actinobacillus delphinicola TaxID=51161 RepID=A0A448TT29_9PAST|nr:lysine-sensitive aspartokinase 3 [Actinobacillus delphinicola]VEJ09170.1 aspartate kinase III [Actinobacillus delphinicola]
MPLLSVAKFGGTSVADFPSMQACADILAADPHSRVVVLSASAGVTNLLVALANGCEQDKRDKLFAEVVRIQENILSELSHSEVIRPSVEEHLTKIKELADVIADSAPSLMLTDELISRGEMMSSLIFVHLLRERGVDAEWVDVRTIVRTSSHFGKALPDETVTKENVERHINPLLQVGKIVVTQGFIGRDEEGHTTTLGRGGSDYSAALLAGVLGAKDVLIWTDVAGIYTTDPRIVPVACRIDSLTFEEAAEMATFGAKVLHPATLRPAVRSNIPVYVGSSKAPNAGGTWVTKQTSHTPTFRAIAVRHEQTLLTLSRLNMSQESGFLHKMLSILDKHHIAVDAINASDLSVALTLDKIVSGCGCGKGELSEQLLEELSRVASVKVTTGLSLIALVGNNLDTHSGLVKDIFTVLSGFNIRMISYGTSTNNICLLVQTEQATDIVRALHKNLFEN